MTSLVETDRFGDGGTQTPILALSKVSKCFQKKLDFAGKLAARLGAGLHEETVHAVDNVDIQVMEREVVGLVGESGCGKSTVGRMVAGLLEPSGGEIAFRGETRAGGKMARAEHLKVQMIFQDPFSSLNPRMRVGRAIGEAPLVHGLVPGSEIEDYVSEVMARVGLDPKVKRRYPHQFSGGQRQRIGIARALAVKPDFLVCDEAVAALDVSIQAKILNLFATLQKQLGLSYLFISHDLGVVNHIADRVVIMYLGRVVETAPTPELFAAPQHPYTQGLLSQVPTLSRRRTDFHPIKGEIPSPLNPPSGCHFHPRCPHAFERCRAETPLLKPIAPGRSAACHLHDIPQ